MSARVIKSTNKLEVHDFLKGVIEKEGIEASRQIIVLDNHAVSSYPFDLIIVTNTLSSYTRLIIRTM